VKFQVSTETVDLRAAATPSDASSAFELSVRSYSSRIPDPVGLLDDVEMVPHDEELSRARAERATKTHFKRLWQPPTARFFTSSKNPQTLSMCEQAQRVGFGRKK